MRTVRIVRIANEPNKWFYVIVVMENVQIFASKPFKLVGWTFLVLSWYIFGAAWRIHSVVVGNSWHYVLMLSFDTSEQIWQMMFWLHSM